MKGFVCLFGSDAVWRFMTNRVFAPLETRHEVTYVALRWGELMTQASRNGDLESDGRKVVWLPGYSHRNKRWNELFNISCITHQDRSSSFAVRVEEQARQDPSTFARLERLARPGRYEQYRRIMEHRLGAHPELLELTRRERPDFFVLPSKLQDGLTHDALQLADQLKIPTLMLVSTWDNLSSKGLLFHRPTVIGCLGEQSRRHAIDVQGMEPHQVCVVGAPQYERFRDPPPIDRAAVRASLGVPPMVPLILFAGALRPFDETDVLQTVDQAIEDGTLPSLHLLYRPHPWRSAREQEANFFDVVWRHVTMDPQLAAFYRMTKEQRRRFTTDNLLFELAHLLQVYQVVDAVISPMSTVLLEAMLVGVPTMAVAFGDGKHSWSPEKVSRMLHFKEFYEVPDLILCQRRDDFEGAVCRLVAQIGDEPLRNRLREQSRYFLYQDQRSYGERVLEALELMLARVESTPEYDSVRLRPGSRFAIEEWMSPRAIQDAMKRLLGASPPTVAE